jgi:DNA polymerase-3 subunit delta'
MNAAAANALLKTLEEPSPLNVLILVTSRPRRLPLTILSRCQRIRFSPLPVPIVSRYLQDKCGLDPDVARILATSSGGSISLAMEMNQQTYLEMRDEVLNSLSSFYKKGLISLLNMDFGKDRDDAAQRLEVLRTCFRDALTLRETGNEDLVVYRDRLDTASMLAEKLSIPMLLDGIRALEDATKALEQNANKQLTLEAMMFKLAPK